MANRERRAPIDEAALEAKMAAAERATKPPTAKKERFPLPETGKAFAFGPSGEQAEIVGVLADQVTLLVGENEVRMLTTTEFKREMEIGKRVSEAQKDYEGTISAIAALEEDEETSNRLHGFLKAQKEVAIPFAAIGSVAETAKRSAESWKEARAVMDKFVAKAIKDSGLQGEAARMLDTYFEEHEETIAAEAARRTMIAEFKLPVAQAVAEISAGIAKTFVERSGGKEAIQKDLESRRLVNDLQQKEALLTKARGLMEGLDEELAANPKDKATLAEVNRVDAATQAATRSWAEALVRLNPEISHTAAQSRADELVGEGFLLGPEFNQVRTKMQMEAEIARRQKEMKTLKNTAPEDVVALVMDETGRLESLKEIWDQNGAAAESLAAKAEMKAEKPADLRTSAQYIDLTRSWSEALVKGKEAANDYLDDLIAFQRSGTFRDSYPEITKALDQFIDDHGGTELKKQTAASQAKARTAARARTAERAPKVTKEKKPEAARPTAEESFFHATPDELRAAAALDVTSEGLNNIKQLFEMAQTLLAEQRRDEDAHAASGGRRSMIDLREIENELDFTWQDLIDSAKDEKPQGIRGRLSRLFKRPAKTADYWNRLNDAVKRLQAIPTSKRSQQALNRMVTQANDVTRKWSIS